MRHIELPDSWLFLAKDGELYYNPVCDGMSRNAEPVTPEARLVGIQRRRPIDYPALSIHIRQAVGDRDWGRFLERIALPKPAVIMAPTASDKEKDKYVEAAERVEDGQVSVWPYGSSLTDFMGGSRGQDPFSAFIRHQEEKIVLLSTGGTLTSLAQADTGSLAGGAQMDVWHEIVRKDSVVVAQAVNRMVREYLSRAFPGREIAAEFTFDTGDKLTAQEAANVAATLNGAGWLVKQDELEKAVGFTLVKSEEGIVNNGSETPQNYSLFTNRSSLNSETPFKIARSDSDGQGDGSGSNALLEAFSRDLGPAAEEVKKLLADLDAGKDVREAAAALAEKLPSMMPEDPAMAAVLAEEMARAFGEDAGRAARPAQPVENTEDQPRGKTTEDTNAGSFAPTGGASQPESKKAREKREKEERQKKHMDQGVKSMPDVLSGKDVRNFMPGFKNSKISYDHIAFYQGDSESGFIHIRDHAPDIITGELNHQAMLQGNKIPETIARGTWYDDGEGIRVVHNDRLVILGKDGNGLRILSAYEAADKAKSTRSDKRFVRLMNEKEVAI